MADIAKGMDGNAECEPMNAAEGYSMGIPDNFSHDGDFVAELQGCSRQLIDALQENQFAQASEIIQGLYRVRDRHIYNSIGHLTRSLHEAIVNFNIDAEISGVRADLSEYDIRDASDRLHYVINMTQAAADRTMDRVESAAPIAAALGSEASELHLEWQRLRRREMSKEEFSQLYGRIDRFLNHMGQGADEINQSLQSIILEQGFQDLTGQVLRKVIGLITDVESELVSLVRIAGQVDRLAGIQHEQPIGKRKENDSSGEGPQVHAQQREDVVNGQDDVDDLLSSLGF